MARREGSHRRIFLHFAIRLATTETLHGYPAGPVKHEAKFQRDFIGDFGYLRFRGFFLKLHLFCFFTCDVAGRSRTTCQAPRAVKSPRPHVVTSAREPSEHLSNLFDVIRCLVHFAVTVFESLTQTIIRRSDPFFIWIVSLCHVILYHISWIS